MLKGLPWIRIKHSIIFEIVPKYSFSHSCVDYEGYSISSTGFLPTIVERAGIFSMYTLLKQRRLCWLGHVVRMADGRIPKDLLYGELVQGSRPRGRPQLRYKTSASRI